MKRYVSYRIDECPHCGSDEIARIGFFGHFVKSSGKRVRRSTNQDRLYYCFGCGTLIDVRKR